MWNLPVKIRAQKLASLPAPFNKGRASQQSESPTVNSVAPPPTSASWTSVRWTPVKIDAEHRPVSDDIGSPSERRVAAISVLKQDRLSDSTPPSAAAKDQLTTTTSRHDSRANDVDFSDLENSLSDVSRSVRV